MKVWLRLASFGLVGLILLASLSAPVLAQDQPVLALEPMMGSVEMNGQEQLRFMVSGAQNLNAFEVRVNYDAALLSVSAWEFGDLLSNLALVRLDDEPGSFRIVATQLATPAVSGNGVLLKLTFRGKALGTSPITIAKAEFARPDGGLNVPDVRNGTLTVIEAPLIPTPTWTATAIPTSTRTPTPTPTPTPTSGAGSGAGGGAGSGAGGGATAIPTRMMSPTPTIASEEGSEVEQPAIPEAATAAEETTSPAEESGGLSQPSVIGETAAQSSMVMGAGRMLTNREEEGIEPLFWVLLSIGIIAIIVIVFIIIRRNNRQ